MLQNWYPTSGLKILAAFTLLLAAGCGRGPDDLGRVSGKVTLDGQPLANATVVFSPKTAASQSVAVTDANGEYSLLYSSDVHGAQPGEHRVAISSFTEGDPDGDPPVARVAERVPYKYNLRSELSTTVGRGENTVNFDLATDGPIVQPDRIRATGE
ncbi:MAG TPA: carboxypeptidase-like regulatory domain-containing protein [Candidatus Anammoximicrobium sp.]|nr:carboxypeptidase-like regulatory domain-containing protein [Candidatus Anammoximicrobium sp.]